jgi:glycosyltransferase involved in cell wall biosynthesis
LSSEVRFSVVIPAYNEAELLPRLLRTLQAARQCYRGGPDQVELIVADNVSTDATAAIAEQHGARVARVDKRAIAAARNGGARAACGEILCFVDADMQAHPDTFNVIDRALADGRAIGGATGVTSERWSLGIALTWAAMLPMVWLTRMDTGVVFCRRVDFEAVGGYREERLFGEDVLFLMELIRRGRRSGRRLVRPRGAKAIASARKFDRHGDWHMLVTLPRLCWNQFLAPARAEREARAYWYEAR